MISNLIKLQSAVRSSSDFDAILITSPYNRLYATGFHSSAGILLLTSCDAFFATDFRYIEAAQKINGAHIIQTSEDRSYTDILCEIISSCSIKTLGIEKEFITCSEYEKLYKRIGVHFQSADSLIKRVRMIKSEDEIAIIKKAQNIAEAAFSGVLPLIKPGVRECDIAAELIYQMYLNGADKLSFDPIVVSGRNSSLPHGVPCDKRIEVGDFLTMDFGCKFNGYCSDMTRTVAVGHATDEMVKVYNTVLSAQLAGISAAREGVMCRDVDNAARIIIQNAGYGRFFGHSLGHGVGVEIHELPNFSPISSDILTDGNVITVEPGIYLPARFGVRIEDMIFIKDGQSQNLTSCPKELLIVG